MRRIEIDKSAFPILIEYHDGEREVILDPQDIENGRAFKVLKTEGILWGDEYIFPED